MKALIYFRETGEVFGGVSASLVSDLTSHSTGTTGVIISDLEWRSARVDLTDPENPQAILKEIP